MYRVVAPSSVPDPYARRRRTVAAFLGARSTVLGDLYGYAAELLEDRRPEGWQHLVAHVGRELMNRLADHLAEVPIEDPDAPVAPTDQLEIAERLSEALKGDEASLRAAARELIEQIGRGGSLTRLRAASLVAGAEEGVRPDAVATGAWVRAWRDLQKRFASWAHLRAPGAGAIPADQIDGAWRELTDLLATRVAREPFFDSMDELLEMARCTAPNREIARAALARLRPGTKARFYAELRDPDWVALLATEGTFNDPPAAVREGDSIRFEEWPEGLVLLRFAASAPEDVANAASAVPESDNARVAQLLTNVAALLPAEIAAESGLVVRVVRDLGGTARLLDVAEPAGNLARRLAEAGRTGKALKLFKALLRVDVSTSPSYYEWLPDWKHGRFRHDEYLVDRSARSVLGALIDGDAYATVKALIRKLDQTQACLATEDSTSWRDDVADTQSPFGDDPRHLLLELLRDASLALAKRGDDEREWVLDELGKHESRIFQRLWLHLLAQVPDEGPRRAATLTDLDVLFLREGLAEVYGLLPVFYAEAGQDDRDGLLTLIEAGPDPSRYGLPLDELERLPEEVEAWQDDWRQRLLSALELQLDKTALQRLDALRKRRGKIDRPDFSGVHSTSWIGPTSPKTAEQLAATEHDEIVALLRDFRAEQHFATPTPEGLGRELARAVERDPQRWTWLGERLPEIPPLYVRSWFTGLNALLRSGAQLPDPAGALTAVAWVLEQPADPEAQEAPVEDDVDFYGAQLVAVGVLVGLLDGDALALDERDRVWAIVERLSSGSVPTPEREASAKADPMQLSLSSVRAQGVVGLLRYLQWLDRRLPAGQRPGQLGFEAAPETQERLEWLIDTDRSQAVRAVLAAELPVLVALDREWLAGHITRLVAPEGDTLAQVGWTTYLRHAARYGSVISLLADAYRHAVATLPSTSGDDRRQLADHVALIWRDLPDVAEGLLDELLAVGSDADRARVMATLGRALHPRGLADYAPSADDLERHRTLWDSRLAGDPGPLELLEFGWWWSSGRFRTSDDLQRLTATLNAADGRIGDVRDVLTVVGELLSNDHALLTPQVVELLEALAQARTAQSQYIPSELLANLLEPAIDSGDLHDRAVVLVHQFGEQGYLTLRDLLD